MNKAYYVIITVLVALPLAVFGCKGKVEKPQETEVLESPEMIPMTTSETVSSSTAEPAQMVATETIPPTAAPELAVTPASTAPLAKGARDKEIQRALKNAGFYTGSIDGKIGPKTKKAIVEFQKAKGLKADGKVGPKTWAELEKYLTPQQ